MAIEQGATGRIRAATVELGIDGYEDAAVIGRGGFAVVYRARQRTFHRTVAVKILSGAALDDAALRRFDRERAAIGTLSGHPNIVTVYDSGLTGDGVPYLAMEHLARGSLADELHRSGPVPWQQVLPWGIKLAGALESAHRLGVLHRDIKPENVLLSNFGEPKLADFGIAHLVGGTETRSGRLELSVLHAPPEVVDGRSAKQPSDVYSLASTLVTLLLGRPPFLDEGDSLVRLLVRIGTDPVPDLTAVGAPPSLHTVLEKAMAKKPGDRYPSALAMGRALQAVEAEHGLPPTALPLDGDLDSDAPPDVVGEATERLTPTSRATAPPAPTLRARRRPPRRRWLAGAVGVLLVLAVGAALLVALRDQSPTAKLPPTHTGAAGPSHLDTVGPLAPGTYSSTLFKPALMFQVGDGWTLQHVDSTNHLALTRADTADAQLSFHLVDEVIDPLDSPATGPDVNTMVRPLPADLSGWLAAHPRLQPSATGASSVGGAGAYVDFTVARGYRYRNAENGNPCARFSCVMLFRTLDQPAPTLVGAVSGQTVRDYLVPMGNRYLVIVMAAPATDYPRFSEEAQKLLATLHVASS